MIVAGSRYRQVKSLLFLIDADKYILWDAWVSSTSVRRVARDLATREVG